MKGLEFISLAAMLNVLGISQDVVGQDVISSIEESIFSCRMGGNLLCSGNATTTAGGLLKLTPDPAGRPENDSYYLHTVGLALYKKPVYLLNHTTNQAASVNISFSFRIEPSASYMKPGDGLAFVMFAREDWVGTGGENLGAFARDGSAGVETLAVEFDTYYNADYDLPQNHIGIDTTRIKSEIAEIEPFNLVTANRVYTWVDYDPSTSTLEVRVSPNSKKPALALIYYTRNLLEVFSVDNVWVGFSASNGWCKCYSIYTIYHIYFTSSFTAMPPPSAPCPSPICSPPLARENSNSEVPGGIFAGVTVGVAVTLIGGCLLLFYARRKLQVRRRLGSGPDGRPGDGAMAAQEFEFAGLSRSLKMYSYNQLCAATNNFSNDLKLGEGGFGSVYQGLIPGANQEQLVAVKKVRSDSKQGEREFMAEVSTIGQLGHRNIVQLLGWCSDGQGSYLLVYEFMRNRSLDRHLFPRTVTQEADCESVLSWEVRFKILRGLAAALQYLHEGWRMQIIHRDVKSSNVMLDDNFTAMLGDFGLARMADHCKNLKTTGVAGTYGYIAPEASMTGKYTAKSDVFAFGAVCLEIVCGRKVYNVNLPIDEMLLVNYVWTKLSEDEVMSLVDSRLEGEYDAREVEIVLLLGLLCSHPKPEERPAMNKVIEILAGSVKMPPIPKIKPEAAYYAYPYQNRDKKLFLSGSETRLNKIEMQEQQNPYGFNSTTSNDARSFTRSSRTATSCQNSLIDTDSSRHSYIESRRTALASVRGQFEGVRSL